ncbi:MAG: FHA domain-containing protein [Chloroflexota bacterium]
MSAIIFLLLRFLLAVVLYAFIAWALWTIWNHVKQQAELLAVTKAPQLQLTLALPNLPAETHYFNQTQVTFGRDPTCEFPINDDAISAIHARLSYHHNQWWLEDLNSKNGTYLNNEYVVTPTVITTGDTIRCGNTQVSCKLSANPLREKSRQGKYNDDDTKIL